MKKVFTLFALVALCITAQAQKKSAPTERCLPGVAADWKRPELANAGGSAQLADGFKADRFCNSVVVSIPGAFLDTLNASRAHPLTFQLAAAAFVRACSTDVADADAAIDTAFLSADDRRQGSGEVFTEYAFKTKTGRVARIFVYLNDLEGLLGVIKMESSRAESRAAHKNR